MMDVACDACSLINLLAAGNILPLPTAPRSKQELAGVRSGALQASLFIPDQVAEESLYILRPDDDDPAKLVKVSINLDLYFQSGLLGSCKVESDEEIDWFVRLATEVDDGEAACLAIAKCRKWSLATDDRPAARLAGEIGVPVINSAQLVRQWAENTNATAAEVATTLQNIQTFAKFIPRKDSPDAGWWYAQTKPA